MNDPTKCTDPSTYVTKGRRIHAKWFKPKDMGTWSLTGFQMKLVGDFVEVSGIVRHLRGDHPTNPTAIRIYIDPDEPGLPTKRPEGCTCDHEHVEINSDHIFRVE